MSEIRNALAFLTSVIRSGEGFTEKAEDLVREALELAREQEQKIKDYENMLIYVRDNHTCGAPLLKAIKVHIPDSQTETSITNV